MLDRGPLKEEMMRAVATICLALAVWTAAATASIVPGRKGTISSCTSGCTAGTPSTAAAYVDGASVLLIYSTSTGTFDFQIQESPDSTNGTDGTWIDVTAGSCGGLCTNAGHGFVIQVPLGMYRVKPITCSSCTWLVKFKAVNQL